MRFEFNGDQFKFWFKREYKTIPNRPDPEFDARTTYPYTTIFIQKLVKLPMGGHEVDAWQPYLTFTIGTYHKVERFVKDDANFAALRAVTKDTCSKDFKAAIFEAYVKRGRPSVPIVLAQPEIAGDGVSEVD